MGDVQNLADTKAIEKLKELVNDARVCFFVTRLDQLPLSARPMSTQEVDEAGNIWFLSKDGSHKNLDIEADNRVQLFYCNNGSAEYVSVFGTASIITDRSEIEDKWSPIAKAWFTEGKDDPSITLIKVNTTDAYYWDTKNNKLVSLVKIAVGAVTGVSMDDGIEGKMSL